MLNLCKTMLFKYYIECTLTNHFYLNFLIIKTFRNYFLYSKLIKLYALFSKPANNSYNNNLPILNVF